MGKFLIVVDAQKDFIDGSLGTKEAVQVFPKICNKIKEYSSNEYITIFTMDTHDDDDYLETNEGKHLPVKHCIMGTEGHEVPDQAKMSVTDESIYAYTVLKRTFGYSDWKTFLTTGISPDFVHVDKIELIGYCTDICVVSNALILKSLFPEVEIKVDASCCAGTTPIKHKEAIDIMKSCQIGVYND